MLGFKVSITLFSTGTLRNSNADYLTQFPNEHTSNNLIYEHEAFHIGQIQTEPVTHILLAHATHRLSI